MRSTTFVKVDPNIYALPKNYAEVLRTPILQNVDRLLPLRYLLKMKIAAPDKFLVLVREF